MAAVVLGVSTNSTANVATYASAAFTPAAGDLLVVVSSATGTVTAAATVTNSAGTAFTQVNTATKQGAAGRCHVHVANATSTAVSQTCTVDYGADPATGAEVIVLRVSGMTKTGATAIRQSAVVSEGTTGTTPAPAFASAALTSNACVGMVGAGLVANFTAPAGWTERADDRHTTPDGSTHAVSIDSGFTGTTVTWGATVGTVFGAIIAELDTSGATAATSSPTGRRERRDIVSRFAN